MEWNLLAGAQLLFFGLGAWYFWRSSRRKGAGEGLRCEDNIVEMDKLMAMEETISGADQTADAGRNHRAGKRHQGIARSTLRPQSAAYSDLRPSRRGENSGGEADSGGSEKKKGLSF